MAETLRMTPQMPDGQMPDGQMPDGQMPAYDVTPGPVAPGAVLQEAIGFSGHKEGGRQRFATAGYRAAARQTHLS